MRFAIGLLGFVLTASAVAQVPLQQQIRTIAEQAKGTVGVACELPETTLPCDLNAQNHAPMQSMFKFPLALTVLHLAETGKLFPNSSGRPLPSLLDYKVRYLASDRIRNTFSPLQDRFPKGNVDVSLRELLILSAGQSDNVASDILLRIAGGPAVVQRYIRSLLGEDSFALVGGEKTMAVDPRAQYENWMQPAAASRLLQRLVTDPPLTPATNAFLLQIMLDSKTGSGRLRAGLPAGTPLAHRTGTSGEVDGKAPATDDVGLIMLPDRRHLSLAVYVTDAHADNATREAVIAEIGKAVYNAALLLH